MQHLEVENRRSRRVAADRELQIVMPVEVGAGRWWTQRAAQAALPPVANYARCEPETYPALQRPLSPQSRLPRQWRASEAEQGTSPE